MNFGVRCRCEEKKKEINHSILTGQVHICTYYIYKRQIGTNREREKKKTREIESCAWGEGTDRGNFHREKQLFRRTYVRSIDRERERER